MLAIGNTGHSFARGLLQGTAVLITLSVIAMAALADPIHHAFETLLGLV